MKTLILILCSLVFFLSSPLAATGLGLMPECVFQFAGLGYRNDDIKWKGEDFPKRFKIDNAQIAKINLGLEATLFDFLLFRAEGDCGIVFRGRRKFNNSNYYDFSPYGFYYYDYDNSHNHGKVRGNYIYDYSLYFGIENDVFCCYCINATPLLGYSYHFQKYRWGHEEHYCPSFDLVHYKARWQGPWAGLNLGWDLPDGIYFSLEYQHHWANFRGKFDIDNPCDVSYFGSFHQSHCGNGNVAKADLRCSFCDGWRVELEAVIQFWSAKQVTWNSYEFNVTTGYQF